MGLLHALLPHNVAPRTARPLLHAPRVQHEGHGKQCWVQLRGRAAKAWALTAVDVDAAVLVQIQALVEANRGTVNHTASHSAERRVSMTLVAAVRLKL